MNKNTPGKTICSFCPNCLEESAFHIMQSSNGKYQCLDEEEYLETTDNLIYEENVANLNGFIEGTNRYLPYMDPKRCWFSIFFLKCVACTAEVIEERIYFFVQDGDLFRLEIESAYSRFETDLSDKENEVASLNFDPFGNPVSKGMLELANKIIEEEQYAVVHRRLAKKAMPLLNLKVVEANYEDFRKYLPKSISAKWPDEGTDYIHEFYYRFANMLEETKTSCLSGNNSLTAIGLRALVELLCQFVGEDTVKGTTDRKFDRFLGIENLEVLSPRQIKFMRDLYAAGNRAVHDGSLFRDKKSFLPQIKEIEKIAALIWTGVLDQEDAAKFVVEIPKRMKWDKNDLIFLNKSKDTSNKFKQRSSEDLNNDNIIKPKFWDE